MFGDDVLLAICMWREARGEGDTAMQAVGSVVRNRVVKNGSNYYAEITRKWQFSSITADKDPQLGLWPATIDPSWQIAISLAQGIIAGVLPDNTQGAEYYYATTITMPAWAKNYCLTCQIGTQRFYRP